MVMKNPPHPGLSVRHDCLEPLGLNVTEAAKRLGVSRKQLSDIVNCHAGISPEMAIRLDKAFGGGPKSGCGCRLPYDLGRPHKTRGSNCGEKIVARGLKCPIRLLQVAESESFKCATFRMVSHARS